MAKLKKIFTIAEALKLVDERFDRVTRMPELIGYRSTDIIRSYKSTISLCNSLSIVFLQYNLFKEAFLMLQKAVQVDTELNKFGSFEAKLWQGRLITYNSLALLFHKLGKHKESLKLLLQAENFLINLTEARITPHVDIEISVNLLTFVTLWKVKKFSDAHVYLERSAKLINLVISRKRPSNISKLSSKNLYGIIVMGLAALKYILETDRKSAIRLAKEAVQQLNGKNILSRPLLLDFITFLNEHQTPDSTLPYISNVEYRINKFSMFDSEASSEDFHIKNVGDWLVSDKYEKVLFITTFVPLISPITPWIDTSELECAQNRVQGSVSEGNQKGKKARVMKGKNGRTESTPRPRVKGLEVVIGRRKLSQGDERMLRTGAVGKHFMFEFAAGEAKGLPLELRPIEPASPALPKLHRTVINFRNIS